MTAFTKHVQRVAVGMVVIALSLAGCIAGTAGTSNPVLTFSPITGATTGPASAAPSPEATGAPVGGPEASGAVANASGDVAIHLSEWSVGVPTTMQAGKVNLSITNIGKVPHELLVFKSDLDPSSLPLDNDGNIIEDGPEVDLVSDGDNITPGASQTRALDRTKPGQYIFVCNIPGHFHAGMFTVVNVTPTPPAVFVPVALNEWHVAVQSTLKPGSINVEAANFGSIQHELLVVKSDLAPSAYPVDKNGDIIEDDPSVNLLSDGDNIDPQRTQTRTVDLTQPGTYLFVCNIPGHFKAGMYSVVTVAP
jgi:uncharacterized cupredoxin-like copper-binding protein